MRRQNHGRAPCDNRSKDWSDAAAKPKSAKDCQLKNLTETSIKLGFPGGSEVKVSACVCPQRGRPGFDPWVRKIPWRKKRQPTPIFLPGESHGRSSLGGYSPWGRKESDSTERLHFHFLSFQLNRIGRPAGGALLPCDGSRVPQEENTPLS